MAVGIRVLNIQEFLLARVLSDADEFIDRQSAARSCADP